MESYVKVIHYIIPLIAKKILSQIKKLSFVAIESVRTAVKQMKPNNILSDFIEETG